MSLVKSVRWSSSTVLTSVENSRISTFVCFPEVIITSNHRKTGVNVNL